MNNYEIKQQARKERYIELAEKNITLSNSRYEASNRLASMIPFGQPILVGHHSEGRHRRDLDKINNNMRKSIESGEKAEYYQNRADNMGNSISSDDPDAIEKLKVKLIKLQDYQADMKERNAEARANKVGQPFERFQLTNNGALVRGVQKRIELLTAKQQMKVNEDITGTWGIYFNGYSFILFLILNICSNYSLNF